MDNPKLIGVIIGLVVGIVLIWQGALEAFIVFLLGLAGWLIGKYVVGEIPVIDTWLQRFANRRH